MNITKRMPAKKAKKTKVTKKKKAFKGVVASMKPRHIVAAVVVAVAVVFGVMAAMGPKLGLQTSMIEPRAMAYIDKNHFLDKGEHVTGFKAISYYSYSKGAVITNKRVFVYHDDSVFSIPLDKISMIVIKDTELGHQDVMIAAATNGVIMLEMYYTYVPELLKLLQVSPSIVKDYSKHHIKGIPSKSLPNAHRI